MRVFLRRAISISFTLCGTQGTRAHGAEGPEDAAARLAACLPLAQRGRVLLQTPAGAALVVDGVVSMAWGSQVRPTCLFGLRACLHVGQSVWRMCLPGGRLQECTTVLRARRVSSNALTG
jgi:hypothetical protein